LAERLVISVDPGPTEQSSKVQDVFGHVLDLFDLLGHSGEETDAAIAWKLVSVSMNSPLTIVAEAIAVRPAPNFSIDQLARTQKTRFARNVAELKRGRVPDAWRGPREVKRMSRAFNPAVPSATRIEVDAEVGTFENFVEVTPADLPVVTKALADAAIEAAPRPKQQFGSIEGELIEVGTFYNQPAIKLRERKSRAEVWCTVTEAHQQEVARETTFEDVWAGRRVLVEGSLVYDRSGDLTRVFANTLHVVQPARVSNESLRDPTFTGDLSAAEYLERFREGKLD